MREFLVVVDANTDDDGDDDNGRDRFCDQRTEQDRVMAVVELDQRRRPDLERRWRVMVQSGPVDLLLLMLLLLGLLVRSEVKLAPKANHGVGCNASQNAEGRCQPPREDRVINR